MSHFMNRQRNILDFAISSLLRRKLKNISLLMLYTLIVSLVASLIFFVQSLKQEAALLLKDAPDIVVQQLMAGRHDLIKIDTMERIAAIRGVTEVAPRQWGYYFDPVFGANYTVMVDPALGDAPGNAVIGQGVAKNQRITEGDIFTLRNAQNAPLLLTVQKVLPYESELLASDMILMAPRDFTLLFGFPEDAATDLAVTVANPRETITIAGKIAEMIPHSRPILKSEILRTYESIFDWRGGMMVAILLISILSFVIFAWDKAAGLSAEEKRETGILKSIGWETSDILLLKFWEGSAVSLSAFLLGIAAAYIHVFFFSAPLFAQVLKGWSVLYPAFRLKPHIDFYQLSTLFFLTVMPYTAATILPSWLTATTDADSAMRS
jgi:ABC-type lipoprotein release transport system permease subunit